MPHVLGYWIYATMIISLIILFIPCTANATEFQNVDENKLRWWKIFYLLHFLSQLVSWVLEIVAYARLSSHYDTDLVEPLRDTARRFAGCGGPNFSLALDELKDPVVYERPLGQTISLIFGLLLLINVVVYYRLYLQALW